MMMTTTTMFNATQSPVRQPDFLTAAPATGHACAVQIDQALRAAFGIADLLVLEMPAGQDYAGDLVRQIDRSASVVYLNLGQYRNDAARPAANIPRMVTLRVNRAATTYQDKDPALLTRLLSASVVIIDEPDEALRSASYQASRLLRWCITNISLCAVIVRDAESIDALCIEHALIRVVPVIPVANNETVATPPCNQPRTLSQAMTKVLMRRLGNGGAQ